MKEILANSRCKNPFLPDNETPLGTRYRASIDVADAEHCVLPFLRRELTKDLSYTQR